MCIYYVPQGAQMESPLTGISLVCRGGPRVRFSPSTIASSSLGNVWAGLAVSSADETSLRRSNPPRTSPRRAPAHKSKNLPQGRTFVLCAGEDSNLRRPKPTGLQPVVIDHSTTDAWARAEYKGFSTYFKTRTSRSRLPLRTSAMPPARSPG